MKKLFPALIPALLILTLSFFLTSCKTSQKATTKSSLEELGWMTELGWKEEVDILHSPAIGNLYFTQVRWGESKKNTVFKSNYVYAEFDYLSIKDFPITLKTYVNGEFSDSYSTVLSKDNDSFSIKLKAPVNGLCTVRIIYYGIRMTENSFTRT